MTKTPKEYISAEGSMNYELELTKKQFNFNNWLYSKMIPYLKGDILETGSGCGTFSERLIRDFKGKIYLTEIDPLFLKQLKKNYEDKRVHIAKLDLNNKKDFSKIKTRFDSIFSSNVLEHIKDDILALKLLGTLLKPEGRIVLLVPCHKFLFSDIDIEEGHYRRYTKKELREKAKKAGFEIKKEFWFDMIAVPARYISGNLLKIKKTPAGSLGLFNRLIHLIAFIEDKILRNSLGVSRIIVIEKNQEDFKKHL